MKNTKKLLALLLALVLAMSLFAGCSPAKDPAASPTPDVSPSEQPSENPSEDPPEPAADWVYTDSAGREVTLPGKITRISASGALAQMFLVAIAPDLMVTIASPYKGDNAKYLPSYLNDLPEVGQFYGSDDLNLEELAAIDPQIIIDLGEPKKTIAEDMDNIQNAVNIPTIHITAFLRQEDGKQGAANAFRELGKILNREARGEELALYIEHVLELADTAVTAIGDNKVDVLYLTGDLGTNVIPFTSFHAEVLDYLTNNIAVVESPSSKGSGNETDLEQIYLWNPEYIIFAPNSYYAEVATDPLWADLDAVKSGNYFEIPQGPYNWFGGPPSIQRYLSVLLLLNVLYPDYVSFDLQAEITDYYELFYGYDLSDEGYHALTANSFIPAQAH
ncbi:MAG: ABC transporter substrate-binding protein [Oscillospiraceae bacterium]|jgi:iron complex transport system substrate-binding protein|nr:ABC transporter substrate-binding protein [Oscillospiraceae bacterium]